MSIPDPQMIATSFVINQTVASILSVDVLSADPPGSSQRKFELMTSAVSTQVAKAKARIFTAFLRPKRKIVSVETEVVEKGLMIKLYRMVVLTKLLAPPSFEGGIGERGETGDMT